jgi:hypothetical protein
MRFLDYNYVRQTNVPLTPTSEHANFPIANMRHDFRSKVWRTTGYFKITSVNKYVDFKETLGGPQITATLTEGSYSPSQLESEIASKMTAATLNGRTYTVAFSLVNGKWTITGQTYLELIWFSGTNTANSVGPSIGFAVSDQSGAVTYTGAGAAIHTEEAVVIDLSTPEDIDSFVMLWSPLDGVGVSANATIRLQANPTNLWDSPAVDVAVSVDDTFLVVSHFFSSVQEYRYWRVKIVDPANSNLFVQVGKIILTKATQLQDEPERGFAYELEDQTKRIKTEYGNQYVDVLPLIQRLSFNYAALQYSDVLTLERMFRRNGSKIPITVAIDPLEVCFDKDHFLIYGYFEQKMRHNQINHQLFKEDLAIEETF